MTAINITAINVLDNPTLFINPFQFEIQYECLQDLQHGESAVALLLASYLWRHCIGVTTFLTASHPSGADLDFLHVSLASFALVGMPPISMKYLEFCNTVLLEACTGNFDKRPAARLKLPEKLSL